MDIILISWLFHSNCVEILPFSFVKILPGTFTIVRIGIFERGCLHHLLLAIPLCETLYRGILYQKHLSSRLVRNEFRLGNLSLKCNLAIESINLKVIFLESLGLVAKRFVSRFFLNDLINKFTSPWNVGQLLLRRCVCKITRC